jgi:hypothetical protein
MGTMGVVVVVIQVPAAQKRRAKTPARVGRRL